MKRVIEAAYPTTFRQQEASELGAHIKHHQTVVLIGMKRVGISNFLRFFLYHDKIFPTYIKNGMEQLFVQVDLNDLVERNIFPFWTLLLTRLVDSVQYSTIPESEKRTCRRLFVQSIQLKDLFFTVDSVRKVLETIVAGGYYPTVFFIRFDRIKDVVTPELFSNLVGLHDAVKHKVSFVFTSYRPLPDLSPDVFKKQLLSVFSRDMYLKPAGNADMDVIVDTLQEQYHTELSENLKEALVELSGGYVQYVQIAVIRLHSEKNLPQSEKELFSLLTSDEQITFQSEELFESLTKAEKEVLLQIKQGNVVDKDARQKAQYLWNTGMVTDIKGKLMLFSPLFDDYVGKLSLTHQNGKEFTKKEHLLFMFLKAHVGELCERESIIEAVWPEHKDLGVSDWAIDRLVARLRNKLKAHSSPYSVVTVVTRGYKLVTL